MIGAERMEVKLEKNNLYPGLDLENISKEVNTENSVYTCLRGSCLSKNGVINGK